MQPDVAGTRTAATAAARRRFVPHRLRTWFLLFLAIVLAAGALGFGAVAVNAFGAGTLYERLEAKIDRWLAGPPPDRATLPTVEVTDPPETPSTSPPAAIEEPVGSGKPQGTPKPTATPIPRVPVDIDIVARHGPEFSSEIKDVWCSPAGVTTALAIMGLGPASDARQREIASRIHEWEAYQDSKNGDWGPAAMALALDAYGAPGYKVYAFSSMRTAMRYAAKAIASTNSPALLLAWRGAHTWVMTGFKADADPRVFDDAKILGAYIDDVWYPRISSIWGASNKPGTFDNMGVMGVNFLPWKRPEGHYPGRDGKFIVVLPTVRRG
jgi:hypothetical protein